MNIDDRARKIFKYLRDWLMKKKN